VLWRRPRPTVSLKPTARSVLAVKAEATRVAEAKRAFEWAEYEAKRAAEKAEAERLAARPVYQREPDPSGFL